MEARPVPHPPADSLRAFGLGKMDDASAEAVMNHLDRCLDCRKVVTSLSGDDFLARFRQAHSQSGTPAPPNALSASLGSLSPAAADASCTAIPNLPPELAGHPEYQMLRELGRGGMGVVYLAKNKSMDRLEVLKVVNKALLHQPGALERFQREIRSAARLSHANIVTAYSVLHQAEFLAFAMEYIQGEDLAGLVKAHGPLPVPYACYYAQQVAFGLQHAFEKGMVHRDIKPHNLMLARDGAKHLVKILDFGLAKATREKGADTDLTGEGRMLGTPDYMAPEQTVDAARADIRAALYSLGCTLYFLLTGGPPFTGRSLYEIMQAHHSVEARALNLARPEVPEGLAAVVRKMMAKDPAQRYQKPIEVVQALGPFIRQTPKSAPPKFPAALPVRVAGAVERPAPVPEAPAVAWDTLTERSSTSPEPHKSGAARTRRPSAGWRKGWLGGGIGVGVLLLTLLVLWASGVFKVKTKDGTIVLEDLPADAEVLVDGAKVTVTWRDGSKKAEIRVKPGTRKIVAIHGGVKAIGEEVEIDAGGRQTIRVRWERLDTLGKPGPKPTHPFMNSVGMKFVWIKPGRFRMGSPLSEEKRDDDETPHQVTLTKGYHLGAHLVTQHQWEQVMGKEANHSLFMGEDEDEKKRLPVDQVSWEDGQEFCRKLGGLERRRYRLPTEAEWEYACRAGTTMAFWWGDNITTEQANYNGNDTYGEKGKKGKYREKPTPVEFFKLNPWGLHDMHGNLYQWCEDAYGSYGAEDKRNPLNAGKGEDARVLRGGSWLSTPARCRAAARIWRAPGDRGYYYGCRVVLCLD